MGCCHERPGGHRLPRVRLAVEVSEECLRWIEIVNLAGQLEVVSSPRSVAVTVSIGATLCHARRLDTCWMVIVPHG